MVLSTLTLAIATEDHCKSLQYLQRGTKGLVECSFPNGFFSVFWYNSTDIGNLESTISLTGSTKSGWGYSSGEFDIDPSGSLIITNVSSKHQHYFKVVKLDSPTGQLISFEISVVITEETTEETSSKYPRFDICGNESEICLAVLPKFSTVRCVVRDAPIKIPLNLAVRTVSGDKDIPCQESITNKSSKFTSEVVTSAPFFLSSFLTLLVCKTNISTNFLVNSESLLLIQNGDISQTFTDSFTKYFEVNSSLQLSCSLDNASYVVWHRTRPLSKQDTRVLYSVFIGGTDVKIYDNDYQVKRNGSLVVPNVRVRHEGQYACVSSNGVDDGWILYDVIVYVFPVPAYPVIHGCESKEYCVREVPHKGSLSCILRGIRPKVSLYWRVSGDSLSKAIMFTEPNSTFTQIGDIFDVYLSTNFDARDLSVDQVTVECAVKETHSHIGFDLASKLDLILIPVTEYPPTDSVKILTTRHWRLMVSCLIMAAVLVPVAIILAGVAFCIAFNRQHVSEQHPNGGTQMSQLTPLLENAEDKKLSFINDLKESYKKLYQGVQPIPFLRDKLCGVDKVFVQSKMEFLLSRHTTDNNDGELWESLESYESMLTKDRFRSTVCILEGDIGYGKSTLTLQFAYDWCNDSSSISRKIDILIVIRMGQLLGTVSIHRAIKLFLLPKDSSLTEGDISDIISNSSSVCVVLDGFDEYPYQENVDEDDFMKVINKKMLKNSQVIVTTRTPSWFSKYIRISNSRIRLQGFDVNAQKNYISKAVVRNDEEASERITQHLRANPLLSGLCQVPLFFAMFAHLSHENVEFQNISSVTDFFRHVIECLYAHIENKTKDERCEETSLDEKDHNKLEILAFEKLNIKGKQTFWSEDYLCERLGNLYYDLCVRTGIFLREEVPNVNNQPGVNNADHGEYFTKVRFYHQMFCEWYAAHYVAKYVSKPNVKFVSCLENEFLKAAATNQTTLHIQEQSAEVEDVADFLQNLDPLYNQYVFRFACGLNNDAANKIIQYLMCKRDTDKFATLCMLEQGGGLDNIIETVRVLCSRSVEIRHADSTLLQRSIIQLLEIASKNKITIWQVNLRDCFSSVDLLDISLKLESEICLPILNTLKELRIFQSGKQIIKSDFEGILQYMAQSPDLAKLRLKNCQLKEECFNTGSLANSESKKVEVLWCPPGSGSYKYFLNILSGRWELSGECKDISPSGDEPEFSF